MELYIGGRCQGKLAYVVREKAIDSSQVCDGEICGMEDIYKSPVINHFHLFLRRCMDKKIDTEKMIKRLVTENKDAVILCDEVGAGVVPIEKSERDYRDIVGRAQIQLAAVSQNVIRIFCGIGVKIK